MAAKRKALGKGLDALFGENAIPNGEAVIDIDPNAPGALENVISVDIDRVMPNKQQPRKTFDKDKIAELADSIREEGIIQPIIVRPADNGYEIVSGERRYRAAREAGLKEVPCIVRRLSDQKTSLLALVENMQREDLNPVEEAEGLRDMIAKYALTQAQVSQSVGKSRPYIANSIRLLGLGPSVLEMVRDGKLTAGHGRTLLGVEDPKRQEELAKKCAREGWSVRALEAEVAGKKKRPKPLKKVKNPDEAAVENELKDLFGTKVNLVRKGVKGDRGCIELEFYSAEELDRLIELLRTCH